MKGIIKLIPIDKVEEGMQVIWKDINGFEGLYQVSNKGDIKSFDRKVIKKDGVINVHKGKVLKSRIEGNRYLRVNLYKDGKISIFLVHRLVAIAFVPNPENKATVNHKDGNKLNNNDWNLEWNTSSENLKHAYGTGLKPSPKSMAKVDMKIASSIRTEYAVGNILQSKLGEKYGLNQQTVSKIINNKLWTR